jgi:hypothetical protein
VCVDQQWHELLHRVVPTECDVGANGGWRGGELVADRIENRFVPSDE